MADPTLIAIISANGNEYSGWETIEISRIAGEPVSYMRFRAAEDTSQGSPSSLGAFSALVPGVPASGYLAGRLAITGAVMSRQAVMDKNNHAVEIIVAGLTQGLDVSTVDAAPGQYLNQTLQQIASAVASKVGVNVVPKGDQSGADLPFERVSEHIGERRIDFLRRLAMWRNMHLGDDESGNLTLQRAQSSSASVAQLVEGVNCEALRCIMNYQYTNDEITVVVQNFGNDDHNGTDASQNQAQQSNPSYKGQPRPLKIMGDQPATTQEAKMYLSHVLSLMNMQMLEAEIDVPGWLMQDGSLWITHIFEPISIQSPSLFPQNSGAINLYIKGARHKQDELGTHTIVIVSLYTGLGQDPINTATPGAWQGAPITPNNFPGQP